MDVRSKSPVAFGALLLTCLLAACSPPPKTIAPSSSATILATPRADDGPTTARHLQKRYDERISCGGHGGTPAFMCSGIILRGTAISNGSFHTWDPSPKDQTRGAISASWLRGDAPFSNIWAYPKGIIFFPNEYLPAGTDKIYVMCTFPYDGATDLRPGGCGPHPHNPVKSVPCQSQGISTAAQWYALWQTQKDNHQCGFDVSSGTPNSADIFMQIPQLMSMLNRDSYNEIEFKAWSPGQASRRPIEAFFYLAGMAGGLSGAQFDQRDFYQQSGIVVPIIRMTLPVRGRGEKFEYLPSDQGVH